MFGLTLSLWKNERLNLDSASWVLLAEPGFFVVDLFLSESECKKFEMFKS